MMAPFDQAASAYSKDPRTFLTYLGAYARYGYVVCTPTVFVMARAIHHEASEEVIRDPSQSSPNPDCWLVWEAVGALRGLLALMPSRLPFVAFQRRGGKLRIYRTARLCALVGVPAPAPRTF